MLARLDHTRVLSLVHVGEDPGRGPFLVAPFLRRGSVFDVMVRAGEVEVPRVLAWASQSLEALAAVHATGVVHRDVKPENILVGDDDGALLSDFGIALDPHDRGTMVDRPLGSINYMAPEQLANPSRVGPAADLYSLGATVFAVLTRNAGIKLMTPVTRDDALALLPPPIRAVVERATHPFPEGRHPDADTLRAEIDAIRATWPEPGGRR